MHHKWIETTDICMQNHQWKTREDQLPIKSPIEVEDIFNVLGTSQSLNSPNVIPMGECIINQC